MQREPKRMEGGGAGGGYFCRLMMYEMMKTLDIHYINVVRV